MVGLVRSVNNGLVTSSCTRTKKTQTGGIAGGRRGATGCINNGVVSAYIEGGSSSAERNYGNFMVGGIAGWSGDGFSACSNKKEINVTSLNVPNQILIGGIVGNLGDSADLAHGVSSCTNEGKITHTDNNSTLQGELIACGGIVGKVYSKCTIENCKNTKDISGSSYMELGVNVGGIVGIVRTSTGVTVSKCSNTGDILYGAELNATKTDNNYQWENLALGVLLVANIKMQKYLKVTIQEIYKEH